MTTERLVRAHQEGVAVTVISRARAEALLETKARLAGAGSLTTTTALLAHVLARTLAAHPAMNTVLEGDELVRRESVSLGVAVALDDGELTVPVVHDAESYPLDELGARLRTLIERAKAGRLRLEEARGAVFHLSNVGMELAPVLATPVLSPGVTGVLLVGGVHETPIIESSGVTIGKIVDLSLTFDHRVINGVPGLRFFKDFVDRIESIRPDDQLRS